MAKALDSIDSQQGPSWVVRNCLLPWVEWVSHHPRITLGVLAVLTVLAGYISIDRYAMNSRLGDLIQQNADWRDDYDEFQAAFPQLVETAIVVVSGKLEHQVDERARALESAIAAEEKLFTDVYAPANDKYFSDNALLYLDLDQLYAVADQLAQAQPMLAAVGRDPSLRGVLELVADGVQQAAAGGELPKGYARMIKRLQRSAVLAASGGDATVPWRDEFLSTAEQGLTHYRLIFLRGKQNYGVSLPNAQVVARLRELIDETNEENSVTVRLTGEVALRHDEVQAATGGVKIAGSVALVLLGAVLAFGVRSLRIVLATFCVLLVGVVWTTAWAMLSVGSFNTLSLVFLVMFFGLGVDFCVHYSLRIQEAALGKQSLKVATRSVGGAVVLCTLTTAIGFLGFLPTPYKGLADLGVISAGGMVVACILTFTLMPALFAEFGLPKTAPVQLKLGSNVVEVLYQRRNLVFFLLSLFVAGAFWLAPRMQFDYSVLALRDPGAESMIALRELQQEKQITDYALYTLSPPEDIEKQKALSQLTTVDRVITPLDYLPKELEDKLLALEDLQELLGGSLDPSDPVDNSETLIQKPSVAELRAAIRATSNDLRASNASGPGVQLQSVAEFAIALDEVADSSDAAILAWQAGVVDTLLEELDWLARAIDAEAPVLEDLPPELRRRLVAPDGRHLNAVLPARNITPVDELSRFVNSVRSEVGSATGRPVVEWGVGNIVLESFQTALLVALGGIVATLLLVIRNVRDTFLVLFPLVLTALFTVATSVACGVAVNMASVLVLPLIFGLGVDNGIHVVERYRAEEGLQAGYDDSSTPRAVLMSSLTTIGTFAALMLSPHAGTASIGFLLTVAVSYLLLFTLFVLPLLLSLTGRGPDRAGSALSQ